MSKVRVMKSKVPEKLYVYECSGPKTPETSPAGEGYLGIWPETPFYYVFYERPARSSVLKWLLENGDEWCLRSTYQLDYEQWQQVAGRDHHVGPFVIRAANDSNACGGINRKIPLFINAGVVFGTGLHATTRGCLLAIAQLFAQGPVTSVVDLGTGTGILALACAKLGASKVIAVDCNPLAARVAMNNFMANDQEAWIDLLVAQDLTILKEPSDLLLMNLEWPCLNQVLKERVWTKYRRVVLSGFLRSQLPQLKPLVGDVSETILETELEDWITLVIAPNRLGESP